MVSRKKSCREGNPPSEQDRSGTLNFRKLAYTLPDYRGKHELYEGYQGVLAGHRAGEYGGGVAHIYLAAD